MKPKVICLDDSEIILEMVKETFEEKGCQVYSASSWPEINNYLFRDHVRFLLCDVQMPGLSGNKLCSTLKESIPNLKIILFSSLPSEELSELAREHGADGWISKNLPREEWATQVMSHLESKGCTYP